MLQIRKLRYYFQRKTHIEKHKQADKYSHVEIDIKMSKRNGGPREGQNTK